MKLDVGGNVYCTGPGGVWVLDPSARVLGRIMPPEIPANCAWGDSDLRGAIPHGAHGPVPRAPCHRRHQGRRLGHRHRPVGAVREPPAFTARAD